jgi:hypothetical protein
LIPVNPMPALAGHRRRLSPVHRPTVWPGDPSAANMSRKQLKKIKLRAPSELFVQDRIKNRIKNMIKNRISGT